MAVNKLPQAFDVEPMRIGDVDAVMAIESVSFRAPMPAHMLLEEMGREWARIDVVRERTRRVVVAFSNYWLVADEVHLLNLATLPEARRAGHASRLLAHIIEVGRRASCRFVTLEVRVRTRRPPSLPPFRLQGGRRPANYYAEDQEDAIVMLLDLA
jgi:ribosomal-protein-alanine N-acetyltransferase